MLGDVGQWMLQAHESQGGHRGVVHGHRNVQHVGADELAVSSRDAQPFAACLLDLLPVTLVLDFGQ